MCIGTKLGKALVDLIFIPDFKSSYTYELYILRHCTNTVYIFLGVIQIITHLSSKGCTVNVKSSIKAL